MSSDRLNRDKQDLGKTLLECYVNGLVDIRTAPSPFAATLSDKPRASVVARAQVAEGQVYLTNLRHDMGKVSDVCRHVLLRLDGQHDMVALCDAIKGLADQGVLAPAGDGLSSLSSERLSQVVGQSLNMLLAGAFLTA